MVSGGPVAAAPVGSPPARGGRQGAADYAGPEGHGPDRPDDGQGEITMATVDRQALFSGVEAPPEHLVLDVPKLAAYLAGKVEGLGSEFTVEKFKGGQSNPTYKLTGKDATYVLRRRPPGKLLASAHAI